MLASAFHPQFKLSWLKDSVRIKVIMERIIILVNEKEQLYADGNTHRIIEEEEQECSKFSLNCIGSRLQKTKSLPTKDLFPSKAFQRFFIKYNTSVPSLSCPG